MASDLNVFGYELLSKVAENEVKKKSDVIILFVHWNFIKSGFRCIGLGPSDIYEVSEQGSELLPTGWSDLESYAQRYVKENKLYVLIGTKSDKYLLLNFLKNEDRCVTNMQLEIETTVNELRGPLESQIPNYQTLLNDIRKNLVEPVYNGTARETGTQTTTADRNIQRRESSDFDPLRVERPRPESFRPPWNPLVDPTQVGRSDLDPFSRGGGMIFDPFTPARSISDPSGPAGGGLGVPGRLPPGAVPPGARFDPFGPPDINRPRPRQGPPDNDHLPPPGYDDMFM